MTLIELGVGSSTILFEIASEARGIQAVGSRDDLVQRVSQSLEDVLKGVAVAARSIGEAVSDTGAEAAEVSFGVKLTAKGKMFVVESSGEATLNVKLKFAQRTRAT